MIQAAVNHDFGYSSGHDCESSSIPSSRNSSDVACSEGICNHDGQLIFVFPSVSGRLRI